MNAYETIIDVTPINYSSSGRGANASGQNASRPTSQSAPNRTASWENTSFYRQGANGARTQGAGDYGFGTPFDAGAGFGNASVRCANQPGQTAAMKSAGSLVSGLVQMAVGAGLVMIGIPMLILPGPGLLSIGAGMALAANGMRKVLG